MTAITFTPFVLGENGASISFAPSEVNFEIEYWDEADPDTPLQLKAPLAVTLTLAEAWCDFLSVNGF